MTHEKTEVRKVTSPVDQWAQLQHPFLVQQSWSTVSSHASKWSKKKRLGPINPKSLPPFFFPLNVLISCCREVSHGPNRPGVRSTRLYHLILLAKLLACFQRTFIMKLSFKAIDRWWESPNTNLPPPSWQHGSFSHCKICTTNPDSRVRRYET